MTLSNPIREDNKIAQGPPHILLGHFLASLVGLGVLAFASVQLMCTTG